MKRVLTPFALTKSDWKVSVALAICSYPLVVFVLTLLMKIFIFSAMRHGVWRSAQSARRNRLDLGILLCQGHGNFHEYVVLASDRPALTYLYQDVPRIDAELLRGFIGMKQKTRVNSRIPHGQTGFTDAHRLLHDGANDVFGNVHDPPRDGLLAEFEEFNPQTILGGFLLLHTQAVVFQRHQDSMRRAFMQTGGGAHFTDAQFRLVKREAIKNFAPLTMTLGSS